VFFKGTRSEYFELYRRSALALKRVDPALRIGGPATANFVPDDRFAGELEDTARHANWREPDQDRLPWRGVWIEEFLAFCARERLPVDFVSAHPYPMDWAVDGQGGMKNYFRSVTALRDDLRWLRDTVARSAFPAAAIHCTEWNTSSAFGDPAHDELCAATYIVEANVLATGYADSVAYWTFTDIFEEAGGRPGLLHGGFGMINAHGLPKPVYHAYRLLAGLGRRELSRGDGWIATTDPQPALLAWNYPAGWRTGLPLDYHSREPVLTAVEDGAPRRFSFRLAGLAPRQPVAVELLSRRHGSLPDAWRQVAEVDPPSPAHLAWLRRAAEGTLVRLDAADEHGVFVWDIDLPPWAIAACTALPPQPVERHAPLPAARVQPMAEDPI
jgi:xylan 1,4-beta-xylosidase